MFELTGKVAVVTGGGSGIGRAISELFAGQGARVAVVDANLESALQTVQSVVLAGREGDAFQCDVTDQSQFQGVAERIHRQWGRIDILVNSAGITHVGTLESTTQADFDKVFSVNVRGVYNAMFAVVPFMKNQNAGVILNLASVAATVGLRDRFAYSMSKGAVVAMTLSVAKDYIGYGIRCNCISPGRVHTPLVDGFLKANYAGNEAEMFERLSKTQPIGRMGNPLEIAQLALYLCSPEASFITGSDYPIDGGFLRLNTP